MSYQTCSDAMQHYMSMNNNNSFSTNNSSVNTDADRVTCARNTKMTKCMISGFSSPVYACTASKSSATTYDGYMNANCGKLKQP